MIQQAPALIPTEGFHVLHLFYSIDRVQWSMLSTEEQFRAKTALTELIGEIRSTERTQLLTFSIVGTKADVAFMILTPDLQIANEYEKRLSIALGAGVLQPTYSYLSMTERSEYTTTKEQYMEELKGQGLKEDSADFSGKVSEWEKRMEKYLSDRLYPNMSDWPAFCFYAMSKKREVGANWYSESFDVRRKLMEGHARVGRKFAGKIRQLITGSTGFDEMEWFVTLQAKDTFDIRACVYDMRFDEVSAKYADFGDFLIGCQLSLAELFRRVCL